MDKEYIAKIAEKVGLGEVDSDNDIWCSDGFYESQLQNFATAIAENEHTVIMQFIEEFYAEENERNPMFGEGYDFALDQVRRLIEGRGLVKCKIIMD